MTPPRASPRRASHHPAVRIEQVDGPRSQVDLRFAPFGTCRILVAREYNMALVEEAAVPARDLPSRLVRFGSPALQVGEFARAGIKERVVGMQPLVVAAHLVLVHAAASSRAGSLI